MKISIHREKRSLAVNTAMLYILTLSNYFFGFITIPYQTRILGPSLYGVLGFATAITTYFRLVLDYGFTLSATAEIAQNKGNSRTISKVFMEVVVIKFFLLLICSIVLAVLTYFIEEISNYKLVFIVYLFDAFVSSLIPDYLYRGMEVMQPITYRTILVKAIFSISVFLFVKTENDYILVPCLYLLGSIVALIIAQIDVQKRFELHEVKISGRDVIKQLKKSTPFFASRIASSVYGATNAVLLGVQYSGQAVMGYYSSAEKVVALARSGASPIADSLYPYLLSKKDFRLVKKMMWILMPVIISFGLALYFMAPTFCRIVFGDQYIAAAPALRAMIPVMILVLPSYIMGFPIMTPMGIANKANLSVILGAVCQLALLLVLWLTNNFSVVMVCLATSATELVVCAFRAIAIYKQHKKIKMQEISQ